MATLNRAIAIAAEAHAGQFDKGGAPYILHPLRVMMKMGSDDERIVAVLHDVVEDCPEWSLARLSEEGFSPLILNAISSVTRTKDESYDGYIERAGSNRIGRVVKVADLEDNLDHRRCAPASTAREEKYRKALGVLVITPSQP